MKRASLIILTAVAPFFLADQVTGQEPKSIHQLELESHRATPTSAELVGPPGAAIMPLQPRLEKAASPSATIFGYLPYWSTADYLRYDLLTHVAAFSVEVNSDGSLGNDHGWPWTNLINSAHRHGVKVVLVATLFDGNAINTLITNSTYRNNFFRQILNKMRAGSADGLNIDFEGTSSSGWRRRVNAFMAELTAFIHAEIPGSEVSFAGPAVNWGNTWDLPGLVASCDYVFIMGYDFNGSWSTNTGPNAPLVGGSINITNTINSQYGFVTQNQPEKLILGVPYYGLHWRASSANARAPVVEWVGHPLFHTMRPSSQIRGLLWDSPSQTPWYRWNDGDGWHQVWFDNDSSLGLKYDLAQTKGLRGVGMWALGYDENRQELWNELERHFGSGQVPFPNTPLSLCVRPENSTALRIEFEAANAATGYFAYLSGDGLTFPDSVFLASNEAVISGLQTDSLYFLRVRAVNSRGLSQATEVLAGVPSTSSPEVLIVNGFDRTSGTRNPLNYIRQHGEAIHHRRYPFSSASNEAVYRNRLSLNEFKIVDWILGDESTADDTFNPIEQDSVISFLQSGGKLFVSGAEIGWDLVENGSTRDRNFYANYLKAGYLADAPNDRSSTYYSAEAIAGEIFDGLGSFSFDDGTHGTFDVDWPDAITGKNGGVNCLKYSGVPVANGVAGIYFEGFFPGGSAAGKLVHLAIPFETIYPQSKRFEIVDRIFDFFEAPLTGVATRTPAQPTDFIVYQNYPNPFNPSTRIGFSLPSPGQVVIDIFNAIGQRVRTHQLAPGSAGYHEWLWNGRDDRQRRVSTGTYVYRIRFTGTNGERLQQARKMIVVE